MNSDKIKSFAKHYFFGLLTSSWNGGIGAVSGIVGIDALAMTGASQQARVLNWHEMGAAFGGAVFLHAIMYFKSHPLPETLDTNPPLPAPKLPE